MEFREATETERLKIGIRLKSSIIAKGNALLAKGKNTVSKVELMG